MAWALGKERQPNKGVRPLPWREIIQAGDSETDLIFHFEALAPLASGLPPTPGFFPSTLSPIHPTRVGMSPKL